METKTNMINKQSRFLIGAYQPENIHLFKTAIVKIFGFDLLQQNIKSAFSFQKTLKSNMLEDLVYVDLLFLKVASEKKQLFLAKYLWGKYKKHFFKYRDEFNLEEAFQKYEEKWEYNQEETSLNLKKLKKLEKNCQKGLDSLFLTETSEINQLTISNSSKNSETDKVILENYIEAYEVNQTVLEDIQILIAERKIDQAILTFNKLSHGQWHSLILESLPNFDSVLSVLFTNIKAEQDLSSLFWAITQVTYLSLQLKLVENLYGRLMHLNCKNKALYSLCLLSDHKSREERLWMALIGVFKISTEDADMYINCVSTLVDPDECFNCLSGLLGF
jgi:hypothetical protein